MKPLMGIQRRVALIGSGKGPWISTQGLAEPRAKVTGLKEGGTVCILLCVTPGQDEKPMIQTIVENGIHSLPESPWMRVTCADGGRNVICDILTRKAVA